ncbi:MAG: FAD-binding oxidoreductase [Burkholderiaceae bacterium]|nr:FAD-binding oxidoreductase [Burkholderiaceae bacterium]MCD8517400.1 FAD-binding oxidoreductase [Burkholderiaceae bacterium]MCD8564986.1 FAD-binding oxidoreductase [Burkholderiaceae bacterium]
MSDQLIHDLRQALGEDQLLLGQQIEPRYKTDWSKARVCEPIVVVRPRSTEAVSAALKVCNAHGHPVTVQGGMTGLVGASQANDGDVVLSLELLNGVQEIDASASCMTVWAGTPLQVAQDAAQAAGLYFAVDLGARGSCQVGGNIATNAGGNRVIRYGMMREQVLGLEVVLADGTVVTSLNKMLKNNAGYDVKQLFIGSEGTLGVVTRAVLRLHAMPAETTTVLCELVNEAAMEGFLKRLRSAAGASLLAFEVMWPDFFAFMTQRVQGNESPFDRQDRMTVLLEVATGDAGLSSQVLERLLENALESDELSDAAIAQSGKQASAFWRIRDSVSEFPLLFAPYLSFDVSLPIPSVCAFVSTLRTQLTTEIAGSQALFFGHIGDSNLHIVVHVPGSRETFPKEAVDSAVYELVKQYGGSVSAEHGIGTRKKRWLGHSRSLAEIELMRTIKKALDPGQILNRGRVIDL